MKRIAFLVCLAVLIVGSTAAWMPSQTQPKPYKVVFDLTSSDPMDQQAVMRWIKEVTAVNPKTETEVVMYGRGLDLVISGKSTMASDVAKAINDAHAKFNVCAIAMKNQQVDKSQLLPNVQTVPDGIGEIVSKQNAGRVTSKSVIKAGPAGSHRTVDCAVDNKGSRKGRRREIRQEIGIGGGKYHRWLDLDDVVELSVCALQNSAILHSLHDVGCLFRRGLQRDGILHELDSNEKAEPARISNQRVVLCKYSARLANMPNTVG